MNDDMGNLMRDGIVEHIVMVTGIIEQAQIEPNLFAAFGNPGNMALQIVDHDRSDNRRKEGEAFPDFCVNLSA